MANDLEDFLRRAAAKRRANAKLPPQTRPDVTPPKHQLTSHPDVVEAEVVREVTVAQKAEPTAYDQVAYDESAYEHGDYQHKTFAREGYDKMPTGGSGASPKSDSDSAASKANSEVTADEILALLRRPGGIKQAVLLKEILERPDHRW